MNSLNDLLIKGTFVLFLAPPGWGKTRLLATLFNEFDRKIIFVSPLRALAEEFGKSFNKNSNVLIMRKRSEVEIFDKFLKKRRALLILTPELFKERYYLELSTLKEPYLVVLDEFHLFYSWGSDFRPILMEVLMGLAGTSVPLLGLSATVTNLDQVFGDFLLNFENCFLIDLGNRTLMRPPTKFYWFLSKKVFNRRFLFEIGRAKGVILYFCQYRHEVDKWVQYSRRKGIKALGCKGGEVEKFILELEEVENVQCIFATTALSHGVNLPSIRKVFIGYQVFDKNFWIQMTGRGGRRGESFELYHFDGFLGGKRGYLKTLLLDIALILMLNKILYAFKSRRPYNSKNSLSRKAFDYQDAFAKWKKNFRDFLWREKDLS
ncbi:MAG: DEAD/DEAH box helicase [Bacteriovoracales bacterium]